MTGTKVTISDYDIKNFKNATPSNVVRHRNLINAFFMKKTYIKI